MNTGKDELRRRWAIQNLAGAPATVGAPSWYRVTNSAGRRAELHVYDEIGVWGVTSADFAGELAQLDVDAIELHINSPGGAAHEGVAIYNALMQHPATITTVVDGWAASAASIIAMAGDRIEVREGGLIMIHKASGMCYGTDEDMDATAEILRKVTGALADIYTARRGGNREDWLKAMAAETWYTGPEAVAAGLADAAGDPEPEQEPQNRGHLAVPTATFDHAAFAAALKGAWSS